MRINDSSLQGLTTGQVAGAQQTPGAGRTEGRPGEATRQPSDVVELSRLGGELARLTGGSAERVAYLEQLSKDVRAGRYFVDAMALSRSLVAEMLAGGGLG